jgi:hypothetical protein
LHRNFDDLFTELCADVLVAVQDLPTNPIRALNRVLDRWKALFQAHQTPMGEQQLVGLFGEIMVLNRLLEHDPSAHRLWKGPHGHRHDFSSGRHAVEVKSSLVPEERRPRIHGLDQLEVPENGALSLAWFRLLRAGARSTGHGFVEEVERARRRCDDEVALLDLLAAAGYHPADADLYEDVRFVIDEERWFRVDATFPGLTGRALETAGVPVSVLDVEYTIDLSGELSAVMSDDNVTEAIDAMIRESA